MACVSGAPSPVWNINPAEHVRSVFRLLCDIIQIFRVHVLRNAGSATQDTQRMRG
jgi:hypothetical protein